MFPGFDGGAEWGGAAFDPESGLLFVNSNEMPWIVKMIPNDDTLALQLAVRQLPSRGSHRQRHGAVARRHRQAHDARRDRDDHPAGHRAHAGVSRHGRAQHHRHRRVPGHRQGQGQGSGACTSDPNWLKYRNDGYDIFLDPDGYPAITPPWGTLNAIDLNEGTIRWKIPFGEFPELAAKGLKNTGSDNYGGPVVTASGLLFIGATNFDKKFRAYDKLTGELLWETTLPAAGNATPSIYSINGREYIVIACGGGKNGAPSAAASSPSHFPK